MFGLGYLLWIGLAVFISYSIAVGGETRSRTRSMVCAVLAAVLIALPFWDVVLGAPKFNRLCKERGGLIRREQIVFPLSSIALAALSSDRCDRCFILLLMDAAAEVQTELSSAPHAQALADHAGLVRYRLADSSDPACESFNAAFPTQKARNDLWRSANRNYDGRTCIVGEPIDRISADYELKGPAVTEENHGIISLHVRTVELRRRNVDQPLATLTRLIQQAWLGDKVDLPPARSCPALRDPIGNSFGVITLAEKLTKK